MTQTHHSELRFAGLSQPVHLQDAPALMSALCSGLSGWAPTVAPIAHRAEAAPTPLASVRVDRGHHAIRSVWLDAPMTGLTTTGALCGIVADLSQSWIADRPDHLALHAGGVAIGGRLYALSGEARAGKSTLMARLTAAPWARVLCDDVLPVDPQDHGIGLGIPPRLRLPLPAAASAAFRAHVKAHMGSHDRQYAYLAPETIAPHGTRVPLAAFIILTRRRGGRARLHALPQPEAVAYLIARNMAEMDAGPALMARLTAMTARIACLRLVYSDLEDAVALLRALALDAAPGLVAPPLTQAADFAPPPAQPVRMDQPFCRSPDAGLMQTGTARYLWNRAGNSWHALNLTGQAIWTLLEAPTSGKEIAALLAEAFPDTPGARVRDDVARVLSQMAAAGLINPA